MNMLQKSETDVMASPQKRLDYDLRLRSIRSTKQSFARLCRSYARGEIEQEVFKTMVWALSQYTGLLKLSNEEEILKRLEILEEKLGGSDCERYINALEEN
ncbi:MAG: hypothetical protein PQJ59_12805 [Spirochaetales bacterium]|nr:hypothetical protein [Spirochaetales bacterium]